MNSTTILIGGMTSSAFGSSKTYLLIQSYYEFLRINPKILQSDILNSLCVEYEALILKYEYWRPFEISQKFLLFSSLFIHFFSPGTLSFTLSVLKLIKSNLLGLSWVKDDKNTLAWREWYSANLSSNFLIIALSFKD